MMSEPAPVPETSPLITLSPSLPNLNGTGPDPSTLQSANQPNCVHAITAHADSGEGEEEITLNLLVIAPHEDHHTPFEHSLEESPESFVEGTPIGLELSSTKFD